MMADERKLSEDINLDAEDWRAKAETQTDPEDVEGCLGRAEGLDDWRDRAAVLEQQAKVTMGEQLQTADAFRRGTAAFVAMKERAAALESALATERAARETAEARLAALDAVMTMRGIGTPDEIDEVYAYQVVVESCPALDEAGEFSDFGSFSELADALRANGGGGQ